MDWKIRLGIIGGGQLGKMMIAEAKKLGVYVVVLDPSSECPCHSICDYHIIKPFDDSKAIMELAEKVDTITYELEHIGVDALIQLESQNKQVFPTATSLKIIQDKYSQKMRLMELGIPTPAFKLIDSVSSLQSVLDEYKAIVLKTCFGGYDGKGNYLIKNPADIECALEALGQGSLMAEQFINFKKEISVLACRGQKGEVVVYPVAENIHEDNILTETFVPADISIETSKKASGLAYKVMEAFDGVGMFCVEMFVTEDGDVYVNEVAPRPHNSGHYTIEACITSQFENHIRAVVGLPLGYPNLIRPAVMLNILGKEGYIGEPVYDGVEDMLTFGSVKAHIYGKSVSTPKRKLGHVTICGSSLEECKKISNLCKNYLGINKRC
ncbi:MAG: 5-(carboxyamino)imidazole ribonucleotide synthase [Clostridiales bacterium]|nr:5-(carboxyamino)imidazole ribonucleotide synthase [Clostridiales bacterium]